MNEKHLEQLEDFKTWELLNFLTSARRCGGRYDLFDKSFTIEEIKEVLKDRPHIPNKEESKLLRIEKYRERRERKHGKKDR